MMAGSFAQRAFAVTANVPASDQRWVAVVVPVGSHSVLVPSPQLNWYCTGWLSLEMLPPAVKL
jgi:hypothetical protein